MGDDARAGASPARTLYDITSDTNPYRVRAGLAPALAVLPFGTGGSILALALLPRWD